MSENTTRKPRTSHELTALPNRNQSDAPFDALRHIDEQGNEYWMARELMPLLGYKRWDRVPDVIDRAMVSCQNAGNEPAAHFSEEVRKSGGRSGQDYKLSRYGAYLTAMNGDPRKPEIAAAQSYFAVQTRVAETVVPQQSAKIEELKLRLQVAEAEERAAIAKHNLSGQFNSMCALHGEAIALASIGQGDRVVDVEKPTIEVHTQEGEPFKGQTLSQLKTHLEKKYGVRFKSGAEIQRRLQALGRGDLVEYIPRQVNQGAVSADKVEEAIALLTGGDRQMLLGEGGDRALVKRKPTKPSRARETAGSYA